MVELVQNSCPNCHRMKKKKFMRISKNPINGQKNKVNNVFGIKNLLAVKK